MNTLQIKNTTGSEFRGRLSFIGTMSAACLFAGVCGSVTDMFAPQPSLAPYSMLIGCGILIASWLMRKLGRAGRWLFAALLLAGAAYCALQEGIVGGFFWCINHVSSSIGAHLAMNLPQYPASEAAAPYACAILAGLGALGCLWLVQLRSRLIPLVFAACIVALDLALGLAGSGLWLALLALSVLMMNFPDMLMLRDSGAGFVAALLMCAAAAGIFLPAQLYLSDRELPQAVQLHDTVAEQVEAALYGGTSDLPEGDFSSLGALTRTADPALEITMSTPESLYLRGFIGSEYTSDGWKAAENSSLAEHADLFYWLHQSGFYAQTQLTQAALLLDDSLSANDLISLTVKPVGASRKYIYAPYELADSDLLNPSDIGDIQLRSRSLAAPESYSLTSLTNQVKRYSTLVAMLEAAESDATLEDYLTAESHYNACVYDQFLSVPDDVRALLESLLGPVDFGGSTHLDYGSAKQRILVWLDENVAYRENLVMRVEGADFLEDFLTITQSGYDVHYATAAVTMMRYFGIPARYVEGYLVTPDDAAAMEDGVAYTLDGAHAHAWAEIYQDGIGWIPFEVTPKYMDLMEQADALRGTGAAPEDSISESETPPVQENSLDMEEDFHEDPEEDDEDEDTQPFPWIGWALLILLPVLLLLLAGLWLSRRIAMLRLNHSFRLSDRKKAAVNLYAYLFSLMREIYQWPDCVAPSGFTETVRADLGEDAALKYQEIVRLCEKSAFSSEGVLETDYRAIYVFTRKTRKLLEKRAGRLRRFRLRYFEHLI